MLHKEHKVSRSAMLLRWKPLHLWTPDAMLTLSALAGMFIRSLHQKLAGRDLANVASRCSDPSVTT